MSGDERKSDALEGQQVCGHLDLAIADLASRQHGVVALRQLTALGATPKAVRVRLERGRLLPLHRGVYAVGHRRLRREGFWLAAVLAVGPEAVLSHRDAAALHDLRPANHQRVDVTTTRPGRRTRAGIAIHFTTTLTPDDLTMRKGVPVTTVARTLVDLAGVVPAAHVTKTLTEAERRGLLHLDALIEARDRLRTRHGLGYQQLQAALADREQNGLTLTRSVLEDRFLSLVANAGLPRPKTNAVVDGYEVDAWWPTQRVAVELDSYGFHHTRSAFQADRTKANDLTVASVAVLRFTHRDIVDRANETARRIAAALRLGGRPGPASARTN